MQLTKPKVSICIPTYNEPKLFKICLESIKIQTYDDYEIIVTDDSPNEEIKKVISEFSFDCKLKYFKNKKRLGTPENWNESAKYATGDYIKILHHDDQFYDKNSLFKFVSMLSKNPNSDFAFSASQGINIKNKFIYLHTPTKKQLKLLRKNPEFLLFGNFIGSPSATIYKNNKNIKYDKKLKWLVDIDFYIRNLSFNKKFIYCKDPLTKILMDGKNQVTREFENNLQLQKNELIYLYNKLKEMYGYSFKMKLYSILYFTKIKIKKILIWIDIYRLFNKNKK